MDETDIADQLKNLSNDRKAQLFDKILSVLLDSLKPGLETKRTVVKKATIRSTGKSDYVEEAILSPESQGLLSQLKQWRNTLAKDLEIPPYMVLDNKTLASVAHYRPKDTEALLKIKGLGTEKVDKYGEDLLSMVAAQSTNKPKARLITKSDL